MNKNVSPAPNSVLVRGSKGFVHVFILTILALIVFGGIGYYAYKNGQIKLNPPQEQTVISPTPDPTANWKIYRNEKYGFEIKYPGRLLIDENFEGPDPTGSDQTIQISNVETPFGLVCYYESGEDPCKENIAIYIGLRDLSLNNETFQEHIYYSDPDPKIQKTVKINSLSFVSVGKSQTHYLIEKNNIAYNFTLEAGDGIRNESRKIYDQILSTFRFLD